MDLLQEMILDRYEKAFDVRESMKAGVPVTVPLTQDGLFALAGRYSGAADYTDLVLV